MFYCIKECKCLNQLPNLTCTVLIRIISELRKMHSRPNIIIDDIKWVHSQFLAEYHEFIETEILDLVSDSTFA